MAYSICKGITVIFELAGGIVSENTVNPELVDIPREGSMLVCSFSRLSSTSELQLLTKQELKALEASGMRNSFDKATIIIRFDR